MTIPEAKQHLKQLGLLFHGCEMSRDSWERFYVYTSPELPGKRALFLSCEMRAMTKEKSLRHFHFIPAQ